MREKKKKKTYSRSNNVITCATFTLRRSGGITKLLPPFLILMPFADEGFGSAGVVVEESSDDDTAWAWETRVEARERT